MVAAHYEKQLKIKTTGWRSDLKKSTHHHRYEPTPYEALDELFYEYDLQEDAVLVDFGSGKGRVPFYVHSRFQNLVKGIEMSEELHAKALLNKETFRTRIRRGKGKIRFKQKFAERYTVKKEDTHFYFFNPFTVELFQQVVQRIIASAKEHPREIDIILYYPTESYIRFLERSTPFRVTQEVVVPGLYEKDDHARFLIYRMKKRQTT